MKPSLQWMFALLAGALAAQAPPPGVEPGGKIVTRAGTEIGHPLASLLAWPRSEVHKRFGLPEKIAWQGGGPAAGLSLRDIAATFRYHQPVSDFYLPRNGLNEFPIWVDYHMDPRDTAAGIRQRVRQVRIPAGHGLRPPELSRKLAVAAELCAKGCAERRHGDWIVLLPTRPTADQLEVAGLVAAQYRPSPEAASWTPALRFRVDPAGVAGEIQLLPVPMAATQPERP